MNQKNDGQWYNTEDRPRIMNTLAAILDRASQDLFVNNVVVGLRDRYYEEPYRSSKWFDLDGELAKTASEVLKE